MYDVQLSREAERFYKNCGLAIRKKLARCFASLENNPRSGNNVKPLKGHYTGSYRYRVGDLRVIFAINDRDVSVLVITIVKRGDAYA